MHYTELSFGLEGTFNQVCSRLAVEFFGGDYCGRVHIDEVIDFMG